MRSNFIDLPECHRTVDYTEADNAYSVNSVLGYY